MSNRKAASNVTVYLGTTTRGANETDSLQIEIDYRSLIFIHERYGLNGDFSDDIALIKLPKAIEFNKYIGPATLPPRNPPHSLYHDQTSIATGWGFNFLSSTLDEVLNWFVIVTKKNTDCVSAYAPGVVKPKHICGRTTGTEKCFGYIGGPLVTHDDSYLIGINSVLSAYHCQNSMKPVIFMRVTDYFDWIESKSGLKW